MVSVETHHVLHCLLKISLSDLLPGDWTQTLIQTIQILKEEKTAPKPWKKTKKTKNKKFHPSPVQLLRPSLWVETFFFVFSRFWTLCQSNNVSCSFFCFCFPFPWVPGINFHPDKHPLAQLSPLHFLY